MGPHSTRNSIVLIQMEKAETYKPVLYDETDQHIMLISAYGELQAFRKSTETNEDLTVLRGVATASLCIADDLLDPFEQTLNRTKHEETRVHRNACHLVSRAVQSNV